MLVDLNKEKRRRGLKSPGWSEKQFSELGTVSNFSSLLELETDGDDFGDTSWMCIAGISVMHTPVPR